MYYGYIRCNIKGNWVKNKQELCTIFATFLYNYLKMKKLIYKKKLRQFKNMYDHLFIFFCNFIFVAKWYSVTFHCRGVP